MKLEIPKPISEVDITHAETIATHVREAFHGAGRNPDYTNSEYSVRGSIANLEFRRVILEDCKVEGLIPGCIVVHKKINKDQRMAIMTWGIVFGLNAPDSTIAIWKPIRVKWVSGSFEDCHATDLIIMNYAPDKGTLQGRARRDFNANPAV